MTAYKYKVYTRAGESKVGEISASSSEEAESKLSKSGDTVVSIVPLLEKNAGKKATGKTGQVIKLPSLGNTTPGARPFQSKKAKPAEIAGVLRNLAVMAESGVPFFEALEAVSAGVESPVLKTGLKKISDEVMGGRSLGQSLKAAPDIIPGIVCDIVTVGEESGKLDKALAAAANYLERAVALRQKLTNALIYPCVLAGVAALTVFGLIFFIMPRFAETFKGMNIKPPAVTQALMDFGTSMTTMPWLYLVGIPGFIIGTKFAMKNPKVKDFVIRFSRKIPALGIVLRQLSVARMLQTLSSLMAGGVPLMSAIQHSSKVSGDPDVEEACLKALSDVERGGMLSESFAQSKVLPPTIVQMMAVGEKTGRLAPLISRAAEEMEITADVRLKSLMAIFEPMMILVMGFIIGLITLSLIAPLFTVIQNVN